MPSKLIVVGSGVTGAEFASAYNALGVERLLRSAVGRGDDHALRRLS